VWWEDGVTVAGSSTELSIDLDRQRGGRWWAGVRVSKVGQVMGKRTRVRRWPSTLPVAPWLAAGYTRCVVRRSLTVNGPKRVLTVNDGDPLVALGTLAGAGERPGSLVQRPCCCRSQRTSFSGYCRCSRSYSAFKHAGHRYWNPSASILWPQSRQTDGSGGSLSAVDTGSTWPGVFADDCRWR
jgi:hypothetical protein